MGNESSGCSLGEVGLKLWEISMQEGSLEGAGQPQTNAQLLPCGGKPAFNSGCRTHCFSAPGGLRLCCPWEMVVCCWEWCGGQEIQQFPTRLKRCISPFASREASGEAQ